MTPSPAFVVVLAGGTARRLGGVDKTALDVGGRPVLGRLLGDVGPRPVVVVGPPRDVGRDVLWAREDPVGGGPFAGLAAGVAAGEAAWPGAQVVVALAGDQPFAGAAVTALLDALDADPGTDAAVATGPDGRVQPLLAAYRLPAVRERLRSAPHGRPARELLAGLRTTTVALDGPAVLDVDDADDLATARRLAVPPGPVSPPRAPG